MMLKHAKARHVYASTLLNFIKKFGSVELFDTFNILRISVVISMIGFLITM